jgi:Ca2+-binding RTX toxin-like protein
LIEGRGGNDIIDGDARLHVALTRDANGQIFAGSQIIREILTDQAVGPTFGPTIDFFSGEPVADGVLTVGDVDTAVFGDVSAAYQISIATDAAGNLLVGSDGNFALTVSHVAPTAGAVNDGTDTLYNIERLQFSDVTFDTGAFTLAPIFDSAAQGALTIDNATPAVGDVLSVTSTINDFEGVVVDGVLVPNTFGPARIDIPLEDLDFQWQMQVVAPGGGGLRWVDIAGATGTTFAPTDFHVGNPLRVQASFIDGLGVKETVASAPTAILVTNPAVNHAPTVVTQVAEPGLFDTSARADQPLTLFLPLVTTFTDDTTAAANLIYTATLADGSDVSTVGLAFATTPDGAGGVTGGVITGTPPAGFTGTIDVRVKATDAGGLSVTDTFTINVVNVLDANAAPVITSLGGNATGAVSVGENATAVTTVAATDPNVGDVLTFSIIGGADAALFTIDPTTGALSFVTAPSFAAPTDVGGNSIYDVIVQVSDGNLVDTQAIAVTVTNVNEAPVITSNGGGVTAAASVAENSSVVTTVTATDPDAGAIVTFSIAGGADATKFTIDPTTGVLSFVTAPDFEAPSDAGADNVYDVIVQVSDGSLVDAQAIAVTVTDVAGVTLTGTGAANTLTGTGENDTLSGLGGADILNGLDGPDALLGGAGADTLNGGDGNDTLIGGVGNDILNGGTGNDTFTYTFGDGADTVDGGPGTDTLSIIGTAGNNTLDVVFDGTAITQFEGGTVANVESITTDLLGGTDTLTYAGTTADVTVNLATGAASGFTSIANIENVTGGSGNDTLTGDANVNNLNGGAGNDTLDGGGGADTLVGGAGDDTFITDGGDTLTEGGGAGTDTVRSSATFTLANNFENLVLTGAGNINGTGNGANNVITGNDGSNMLTGGAGADALDGGIGNDTLVGGTGNDTMSGGTGNDTFLYTFGDGADAVDGGADADTLAILGTAANNTLDVVFDGARLTQFEGGTVTGVETVTADLLGGTDTLTYAGTTAAVTVNLATGSASGFGSIAGIETVTGGSGNDSLTGSAGVNTLNGGAGNDTLDGGLANDTLVGGAGDDTYIANQGDTITEGAGGGTDTVLTASTTFTLANNVENLIFTGAGNFTGTGNGQANTIAGSGGTDVLSGAGGDDTLIGNGGVDSLSGGAGNDTLVGGAGNDIMNGGAGNDTFVFGPGFGNDIVSNSGGGGFDANPAGGGQDLLDISGLGITAATFAAHVAIVDLGADMLVTIDGTSSILVQGVNGVGANTIAIDDFRLA